MELNANAGGPKTRSRIGWGACAGLVAAAGGLGVAELVASSSRTFQSPVVDVADRVVDGVPRWVKDFAIERFGTNDKIALLVGISVALTLYSAAVGIVSLSKRWVWSIAGIGLFGLAGSYASQTTRRSAPIGAVIPSVVGALIAAFVLVVLRRAFLAAGQISDETMVAAATSGRHPSIAELVPSDRRRFLISAGIISVGAVAAGTTGRRLSGRSSAAASRSGLSLPLARSPLPGVPAGVSSTVPGVSPFFTPNRSFYRIDTAITVPQVPVEGWRLAIKGLVDRPMELSFDELIERELVESDITLTCVSNEIGGKLLGTARWLGIRLDDLLAEAGPAADADQIVGRSVDGYTCGFPTAALDGRDALIAIGMNGELLPVEHGFPARLIVPGLYGYVSATKWLSEIELTRFADFDQYWVERGWADDAPIKVQSRIDTPKGLSNLNSGTVAIGGVAWAQTRGIERVEIRVDDGEWADATLSDELNAVTWRQWSYAWEATPGRHEITVRATEANGPTQTEERAEPFPSGATGQHQIIVIVT